MAKIKAPKVQSLGSIMSELAPAYNKQRGVIEKRQAGLGEKYDAQRAGIKAERGEGFNTINNQATGRGMSFSGIPLDEQARYLSTKYLPGLQQADYQQNEEDLALQGELADIFKEQRTTAFGERSTQKGRLADWRINERGIQARNREAARQRAWDAKQSAIERSFTASQNAADRAASAASAAASRAASAPRQIGKSEAAYGVLSESIGKNGTVSPLAFRRARELFIKAGGSNKEFMNRYWKFTGAGKKGPNRSIWKQYYYG